MARPSRFSLGASLAAVAILGACGGGSAAPGAAPEPEPEVASTEPPRAPAEADPAAADEEPVGTVYRAGAASIEITPQTGVPLGGYGARQLGTPDLNPNNAHTLFKPSTGVRDPLFCKALYLSDGEAEVAFVALDGIAVVAHFVENLVARQAALGGHLKEDDVMVFASHSHSGPGAVTKLRLWALAAMDLHVAAVENALAEGCAQALWAAQSNAGPARVGSSTGTLKNASKNRRASVSPYVTADTVDEELTLLRVDRENGEPLALLWNYAIHGTSLGPENLRFSGDVMGAANAALAARLPTTTALFANGAEGDAAPATNSEGSMEALGARIADAVASLHAKTTLDAAGPLKNSSEKVSLGQATVLLDGGIVGDVNLGPLGPILNATQGVAVSLGPDWVDSTYRFQAVRVGEDAVFASVPGEAIHEIGQVLKTTARTHGARDAFVVGLANGYMGYITSAREFDAGGYEAQMSLFGRQSGTKVIAAAGKRLAALQ
jgi:neutral ceramidase